MSVVGALLAPYLRLVNRRLRRAAADPAGAQRRVFESLLRRGKDTVFGREHGFARIRTPAEFARAVPIRDYVGRLEMFQRILAGEPDVSWPGRVRYFAQTSGTTAGDKRIPVTDEMMRANRRAAVRIFAYYDRRDGLRAGELFGGKLLFLGGSTALEHTESGALVGDLSGIATQSILWPISRHYEPGEELALIDDWEEKVSRVAERTAGRDVRFITGMPSWVKVLFDRVCSLRGVAPSGGISRVWPNLRLFVHGGVNFAPYREGFLRYFAGDHGLEFLEVYPASEGFVAIQAERDRPGMEVMTDNGLFYEFVPLSEWGREDAPRLGIGEVETGIPYSVVLSTCAGLWAYDLGDVVRFTSVCPPRVVFAGRNRQFINAFGENVIGEQVSAAVAGAADRTGARVAEFTAGPVYPGDERRAGAHEYVIEFEKSPEPGLEAFAGAVDDEVTRLNHDYSVKRGGNLGMTRVEVTDVPRGTFHAWMKAHGKLGGQHKVPVCSNDREMIDELRRIAEDI